MIGKFAEVTARLPEADAEEAPVEWKIPHVPEEEQARLLELDLTILGKPPRFLV